MQWTSDALLPYVAYVDSKGKPKDWLFDSFLMIEYATDTGVSLYYEAVYRFLKGTYEPTNRNNLPKLTITHHKNTKNQE